MAYPQGYLYQPSASLALYSCGPAFGAGLVSGPRTEELRRSSSGSAFAPYAGATAFPAASPGLHSAQYGGAHAESGGAPFSPYMGSPYDLAGSVGFHPYAGALAAYPFGDPAYRKNATRDATATLKAWLSEHRKNPYPTKGEKIMLAIITKMTLTQVSTWFANARRRLKKENKVTWTPRPRSEDEEEEDNIDLEKTDEDEEPLRSSHTTESTHETDAYKLHPGTGVRDACSGEKRGSGTDPGPTAPRSPGAEKARCASKPKLWSLAEIATSPSDPAAAPFPGHVYYAPPLRPPLPGYCGLNAADL